MHYSHEQFHLAVVQLHTAFKQGERIYRMIDGKENCYKVAVQMKAFAGSAKKACDMFSDALYGAIFISANQIPTTPPMNETIRANIDDILLLARDADAITQAELIEDLEELKIFLANR